MSINIREILKSIEYYEGYFPEDELKKILDNEEKSREYLIEYIEEFQRNIFRCLNEENYVGHIYAVFILSQFKERSLCKIFLSLLELPGTRVYNLFESIIPEWGARIIASTYSEENIDNILKLLNNRKANEYAKTVSIQALKILCLNKQIKKSYLEDFFIDLLNGKLKDKRDLILIEILDTSYELNLDRVMSLLKEKCKNGECGSLSINDINVELNYYEEGAYVNGGLNDVNNQFITNAFEEIKNAIIYIEENYTFREEAQKLEDTIMEEIKNINRKLKKGIKSFDIELQLNNLTKKELHEISRHLNLKKFYKCNKKELVNRIVATYSELLKKKIIFFDEERMTELRDLIKNDGIKTVAKSGEFSIYFYFEKYGLAFHFQEDEKTLFIMPDIVQEIIKEVMSGFIFRKNVKRNSNIVNLVKGMMQVYGVVKRDKLLELVKMYDASASDDEIYNVINEELGLGFSSVYKEYITNFNIGNMSIIDELIESNEKGEYKIFTKEELLDFSSDDWILNTGFAKEFYDKFVENFVVENEVLEEIMKDMIADIQIVEPKIIIQFMIENLDTRCNDEMSIEELRESKAMIKDFVTNYLYSIPLWRYKGRSMKEIKELKEENAF